MRDNCESHPCEVAETDSQAKFGNESVAGTQEAKIGSHYGAQACSGGSAQACSPSAQVRAATAQVQRRTEMDCGGLFCGLRL